MHPCPIPNPHAVHAWFAAIDPPLPTTYATQLIGLGIVNVERLYTLARLPGRDRWLNEYLPDLDRYEYWLLRRALDQLRAEGGVEREVTWD